MAQYHITASGSAALCTATKRACPRGAHYGSEAEAMLKAPAPLPTAKSYATAESKRLSTMDHDDLIRALDEVVFKKKSADEEAQWENSKFRSFWESKNGKQRGTWGERYLKHIAAAGGVQVEKPSSTENDGVFNGKKIEIKTNGSSYTGSKLAINWAQIRPDQDYDAMIGQVVTPHEVVYFYVPKDALVKHIAANQIKPQHGGKKAENGNTFVLSQKAPQRLLQYQKSLPELLAML